LSAGLARVLGYRAGLIGSMIDSMAIRLID
jgi:hypothetical protein